MNFINDIKEKARKNIKTIVLPEAQDVRVLEAARKVTDEGFAKVILLGDKEELLQVASSNNIDINDLQIINPLQSEKLEDYISTLYELRKEKGMTLEKARETLKNNIYFGMTFLGDFSCLNNFYFDRNCI